MTDNAISVNYVCFEKETSHGMQYTFIADPISYSCEVRPSETLLLELDMSGMERPASMETYERTSSPANNRPLDWNQSPSQCESVSTSQIPKMWTLRSGIPTPPPLPERLPVDRYRISFNWTGTDALIRAHRFPLKTRDWGERNPFWGSTQYEETSNLPRDDAMPSEKPQPTLFKLHNARKVQHPKVEEIHEPTVIEDMAYVFPAGVNAIGVLENKLGKLLHSQTLEAHGEQLQKVAQQSSVPSETVGGALM